MAFAFVLDAVCWRALSLAYTSDWIVAYATACVKEPGGRCSCAVYASIGYSCSSAQIPGGYTASANSSGLSSRSYTVCRYVSTGMC